MYKADDSRLGDELYREFFREIHLASEFLLAARIRETDRHLNDIIKLALDNQNPTEYPFLFRYSYAEGEQDGQKITALAAAVHLLQTSTFVIDDIFDSSEARNYNETI